MSARVISSSAATSVASRHVLAPPRALEAVAQHRVARLARRPCASRSAPAQQVGRLRHRLHAAADADLDVAGADRRVEQRDRAHPRRADLVDRLRADLHRDAGVDLRLARGDLPLAGLQHGPSRRARPARARRPARSSAPAIAIAAELGRVERREPAAELADRRAGAAEDHCRGHLRAALQSSRGRKSSRADRRSCSAIRLSARARCRSTRRPSPARETAADTLVVGVFEGEDADADAPACSRAARLGRGQALATALALTHDGGRRWLLAGLGTREEFDAERARVERRESRASAPASSRRRRSAGSSRDGADADVAAALVEGTILACYRFERYKRRRRSDAGEPPRHLERADRRRRRATVERRSPTRRSSPRPPTPRATSRTARPTT